MQSVLVNSRLSNLQQSATVLINQKVKDLRAEGREIYHFGFGQSPFSVHEKIQNALCMHADKKTYLPTKGLAELREAISKFMKNQFGYAYPADSIMIGPGSKQLLYQASMVIEGPLIIPTPSWVSYVPQAEITGKRIILVNTKKANKYKLTAEELENVCGSMEHRQKILVLNSPQNPTGGVYTTDEIESLVEVCRKHKVVILADEIYAHITFGDSGNSCFAKHFPEATIVTGGLSKAFSAGGYRLGFVAAPPSMEEVVKCMGVISSQTYTSVSAPIQYAAVTAYTDPEVVSYSLDCAKIHQATSNYLFERFVAMGLDCSKPEGAFYLFPDFEKYAPQLQKKGLTTSGRLANFLLDRHRVAVLPGSSFYYPSEFLGLRVSTTDYDGDQVFEKAAGLDNLDEAFIEENCPNLKKGADEIEEFIESL